MGTYIGHYFLHKMDYQWVMNQIDQGDYIPFLITSKRS